MSTKTYKDKYLYFTFKNIHSSIFGKGDGLFIVNQGDDLKVVASPDSTTSFANPEHQDNTYYLGTTQKQKTFKRNLAADKVTWDEIQKIALWLKVGEKGFFFYDYSCFWGWDVVVTKLGDIIYHEHSDGTFMIETDVEFKTYGDWHARSTITASYTTENATTDYGPYYSSIANDYGIPEIVVNENNYDFLGIGDSHSFVDIMFTVPPKIMSEDTDQINFSIAEDDNKILSYDIMKPKNDEDEDDYYYYGKYGFVVNIHTNEIIEQTDKVLNSYQTSKIFEIQNTTPIQLNSNTDIKQVNGSYWLKYKYYQQLPHEFYFIVTEYKPKKDYSSTYNKLGNIQYGANYNILGSSIIHFIDPIEDSTAISTDGQWIKVVADQTNIWSIIQNSLTTSAVLYACGYHRYQIQAPKFTITVDKHNNNN